MPQPFATKRNIEDIVNHSEPTDGIRTDVLATLPSGCWRNGADGTVLTGASTPAVALLTASSVAGAELVQWAANAANTVIASAQFVMPGEYTPMGRIEGGDRLTDDLVFRAVMRRQRNAADAAAWAARCTVRWFTPGSDTTAYQTLTTNPTASIPAIAADNTGSLVGFSTLTFDIGARLRAEGKRIRAGDVVRLIIGPDAANANAVLQFAGGVVRGRRHLALADRSSRL